MGEILEVVVCMVCGHLSANRRLDGISCGATSRSGGEEGFEFEAGDLSLLFGGDDDLALPVVLQARVEEGQEALGRFFRG